LKIKIKASSSNIIDEFEKNEVARSSSVAELGTRKNNREESLMNNQERKKEDKREKLVSGNNCRNRKIIKKRESAARILYIYIYIPGVCISFFRFN